MKIKLDKGAFLPERAHKEDAGIDLRTPHSLRIPAHGQTDVDTGVHVQLPEGTCGLMVSKSGLMAKAGITSTGLIDEGYTGSVHVVLQNHTDNDVLIAHGDKISQMVVIPVVKTVMEVTSELDCSDRGENGFGSTGR